MTQEQRDALAHFIKTNLIRDPQYPMTDTEPLISGGLIDSFSLVELGLYIEKAFGVQFPDAELTVANMDTLDQIVANIEAKQAQ